MNILHIKHSTGVLLNFNFDPSVATMSKMAANLRLRAAGSLIKMARSSKRQCSYFRLFWQVFDPEPSRSLLPPVRA